MHSSDLVQLAFLKTTKKLPGNEIANTNCFLEVACIWRIQGYASKDGQLGRIIDNTHLQEFGECILISAMFLV